MPSADEILQKNIVRLKNIHTVTARFLNKEVSNDGVIHISQRNQMPPLGMAIKRWVEVVLAVHPQCGVADTANDDVGNPFAPEKAISLSFHRTGFCPDDNAIFKYQLDIRRHIDGLDQPLRSLPVDDDLLRSGIKRGLKTVRSIGSIPAKCRCFYGFSAQCFGDRRHRFTRCFPVAGTHRDRKRTNHQDSILHEHNCSSFFKTAVQYHYGAGNGRYKK